MKKTFIAVLTIVLAVGLSVGLGAKDLVSKVLSDWYEKVKK